MNRVDFARAHVQNGDLTSAIGAVRPLLEQDGAPSWPRTTFYHTTAGRDLYEQLGTLT